MTRDTEEQVRKTFVIGVYQYIRCGILSGLGTPEIEPAEEPSQGLQQRIKPQNASLDKREDPGEKPAPAADPANGFSVPVSGRSITFSMGYAKDILLAEVALKPHGYIVTEEDLQRMIRNANIINNAIVERVTF